MPNNEFGLVWLYKGLANHFCILLLFPLFCLIDETNSQMYCDSTVLCCRVETAILLLCRSDMRVLQPEREAGGNLVHWCYTKLKKATCRQLQHETV